VYILAISNRYPPDVQGGFELQCQQTVHALRRRGHTVDVATAHSPLPQPDALVYKVLRHVPKRSPRARRLPALLRNLWWNSRRVTTLLHNYVATDRLRRRHRPDVVLVWGPSRIGLTPTLPFLRHDVPVVFFVGDKFVLEHWRLMTGIHPDLTAGRSTRRLLWAEWAPVRRLGRGFRMPVAVFVSRFFLEQHRAAGIPMDELSVIYQGVRFRQPPFESLAEPKGAQLLYVGRVEAVKGPHLAVDALRRLHIDHGLTDVTLTLIGSAGATDPTYGNDLRASVTEYGLDHAVRFLGQRPADDVYAELLRSRVLLFTSILQEPGAAAPLEAMGHGVPVVGTDVGSIREAVRDGVDGFIVAPDGASLAAATARLLCDHDLWARMRRNGWNRVAERFAPGRYEDEVAAVLENAGRVAVST
jgi:glycosyltransferase involved in cell wall biosynthesis